MCKSFFGFGNTTFPTSILPVAFEDKKERKNKIF
jgi:hypothetical protein